MNIDIFLTQNLSEDEIVELGLLAEQNGIRALWTYNFLSDRDPFMCLGLLAKRTSMLKMGPTAISPYELHPVKMANSLLTLNEFRTGARAWWLAAAGV